MHRHAGISLAIATFCLGICGAVPAGMAQSSEPSMKASPMPLPLAVGGLVIESAWTRATPAGARVGGGYLKITNTGRMADRLVGGSLLQAGRFEIHEMSVTGGVMTMRELASGLEIGAGETIELKPGGFHLMFMDLKEPLKAGAAVKGMLVFEKAGKVEVEYLVAPVGAATRPLAGGQLHH